MQFLMLAYCALLSAVWTRHFLSHRPDQQWSTMLAIDATVWLAALVAFTLTRLDSTVVAFLAAVLCSIELEFHLRNAPAWTVDDAIAMTPALVIGAATLDRRILWSVFAAFLAILASGLRYPSDRLRDALGNASSMALLFLLLAAGLDHQLCILKKMRTEALAREVKLRRAMEARKRAQARLLHARKIEATGRLASSVASDFNRILDLVLGYVAHRDRILELDSRAEQEKAILRILSGIEAAASRGIAISRKLLTFNRFELAKSQQFDAASAIVEMGPLLRHLLPGNIELELPSGEENFIVLFDRGEFDLMILNIALNARDAMAHGGRFCIHLAHFDSHVRIAFADTGHGMSQEVQQRVFEPFFSTKPSRGGSGLGLSVIHDILLAFDGDIVVESEIGNGTTFHVRVPRARMAAHPT